MRTRDSEGVTLQPATIFAICNYLLRIFKKSDLWEVFPTLGYFLYAVNFQYLLYSLYSIIYDYIQLIA